MHTSDTWRSAQKKALTQIGLKYTPPNNRNRTGYRQRNDLLNNGDKREKHTDIQVTKVAHFQAVYIRLMAQHKGFCQNSGHNTYQYTWPRQCIGAVVRKPFAVHFNMAVSGRDGCE